MSANDYVYTRTPIQNGELNVLNNTGSAFTPGMTVSLDTSDLIPAKNALYVIQGVADAKILGICLENIPAGGIGRIATGYSSLVPAFSGAANAGVITAGDSVESDAAGGCKTSAGTKFVIGDALTTTAAAGDQVLLGVPAQAKV